MNNQNVLDLLNLAKDPQQKAALLKVLAERDKLEAKARFDLKKILFPEQYEALSHSAKRKVIVTSRRAGKSTFLAAFLLNEAMKTPRSIHVYLSLTKSSAKRIIWSMLCNFIEDYDLPFECDNHILSIKGKNGSAIYVDGAKDQSSIERLRGLSIDTAVVDELQSFSPSLARSLILDIVDPAVTGTYGNIILAGTPCPIGKSALAIAWQGAAPFQDYVKFHWTVVSNIYLPLFAKGYCTPDKFLETIRAEKGYKETDPSYIREYLGKFVEDKDALVYGFDEDRDLAKELPPGHKWHYVVSVDAGFNDSDAIVVGAFSYTCKVAYIVDAYSAAKQDLTSLVDMIREFNEKYEPIMTIVDPGGGGLKFVSEMNNRYGIRASAAEKYNPKAGGCAMVASSFREQTFKIVDNDATQLLQSQLSNITFIQKTDRDGNTKRVVPDGKQVVSSEGVLGDDLADACLYAYKFLKSYFAIEQKNETPQEKQKRIISDHMKRVAREDEDRARKESQANALWF